MEGNIAVGHGPQERGVEELSSGSDWGGSNNSREFLGGPVIKTQGFHSSSPGSIPVGRDEIWEDIQPKNIKNLTLDITQNSLPLSLSHTHTFKLHTDTHSDLCCSCSAIIIASKDLDFLCTLQASSLLSNLQKLMLLFPSTKWRN